MRGIFKRLRGACIGYDSYDHGVVDARVGSVEGARVMCVREKDDGCGTMAEVCLGEVTRDYETGEWKKVWCVMREIVRTTLMVTDASVPSSEIVMIAMASASVREISCMRLIIMKWDMCDVDVGLVENNIAGDGK